MKVEYRLGDCLELLKAYPPNHFSSCVTDPPYGLAFMGKAWDKIDVYPFTMGWGKEVFRVLKPGAWLAAFGGTRTWHRQACGLEDAGFEYRDTLMWLYGSGFPKSLDVSKAIDKAAGAVRPVVGSRRADDIRGGNFKNFEEKTMEYSYTIPATPEALKWQGWGTALKPAWEPILLCRKPLDGTVAGNTLTHGTGGINVDGCRIEAQNRKIGVTLGPGIETKVAYGNGINCRPIDWQESNLGRWPSNLLLDEESAKMLDEQSGVLESGSRAEGVRTGMGYFGGNGDGGPAIEGNIGGASRFFYIAKASRSERERGVKGPKVFLPTMGDGIGAREHSPDEPNAHVRNHHPTVKPLALMQWLVRLVTPKEGICLEPFAGSGTTILACQLEGRDCLGIEKDAEYEPIIRGRLGWSIESFEPDVHPHPHPPAENDASNKIPRTVLMSGQ